MKKTYVLNVAKFDYLERNTMEELKEAYKKEAIEFFEDLTEKSTGSYWDVIELLTSERFDNNFEEDEKIFKQILRIHEVIYLYAEEKIEDIVIFVNNEKDETIKTYQYED